MAGKTSETVYAFDENALRRWLEWEISGWGTELDPEAAAVRDFVISVSHRSLETGDRVILPLAAVQALNNRDSELF